MTTADSRELKPLMERVASEVIERRARAERAEGKANNDSFALLLCRNLCWAGAALSFVFAFGLSCLRWADAVTPAAGVIHWFVVGLGLSFLGAVTLQLTINQRRTVTGQRRMIERMDIAAGKLREEIRDARPADAVELGQLVAMHQATQGMVRQLQSQIAELMPLLREAYMAGFHDGRVSLKNDEGDGDVVDLEDVRMLKRLDERLKHRPTKDLQ